MNSDRAPKHTLRRAVTRLGVAGVALAATLGVAACGGSSDDEINLVAYSTPQQAYEEGLFPAFEESSEGEGTEFSASFGASGDQSRAVEAGQDADYVSFSIEPDMTRLVESGDVAADWNKGKFEGNVTDSVVVFMVRPGNPLGIKTWDDLISKQAEIITPNPATSGGARWNILAALGSQTTKGKSEQEGLDFVKSILGATTVQDDSARDSLATFGTGKGDVLIGYENEALQAQEEGVELEFVIPDDTILIENPAAVTVDAPEGATKFLDFAQSAEGQQLFADAGYRPVDPQVLASNADKFPEPANLFTVDEFGGWEAASEKYFDDETGAVFKIQQELGNPTE
jgi:sulfate transport system substrate-binding protein